jgi:hypothetical protein
VPQRATALGDGVVVRFDHALTGASPKTAFVVTIDGRSSVPTSVTASGKSLRLALPFAVYSDDSVQVGYAPYRVGATRRLRDAAGRKVAAFSLSATNTGPAGCVDPLGKTHGGADEGPTDHDLFLPSTGNLGVGYVPVAFEDSAIGGSIDFYGHSVPATLPTTVKDMSYGKLSLSTTPSMPTIRMGHSAASYALGATPTWDKARPFLTEAMAIASNTISFARSDVVVLEVRAARGVAPAQGAGDTSYTLLAPPGQGLVG